jgi:hypothetical protein
MVPGVIRITARIHARPIRRTPSCHSDRAPSQVRNPLPPAWWFWRCKAEAIRVTPDSEQSMKSEVS